MPPKNTPKNTNDTSVSDLARAVGLLIRRLRTVTPTEQSEFSWTQKSVLIRLESEGPATTADLARAEGVKPQSMGTALAMLEELGMIAREPHPTDGRLVNIRITPKGITMRKIYKDARHAWLSQAIAKLSKSEQAKLFEAGEIMMRLADL